MGFFTDAYDLFVIGIASTLITLQWNLSSSRLALLNATMLGAACLGAFMFGRIADLLGRKRVYWMVAAIMVVAAIGSALSPSYWVLIAFQLAIFVVAAVPGYILAIARMDRIGHRKLQLTGFVMMGLCFAIIALVPGMTTIVLPFLTIYGISYFFTEFGPNMTTFVMPGELFPVSVRATGHGISAGIGKFGAFVGVFLFPVLKDNLGLRGTLLLTAGVSALGALLTLVLPEPSGRTLEDISGHHDVVAAAARPWSATATSAGPAAPATVAES